MSHGEDGWVVSATREGIAWGVAEVFRDWDRARAMGAQGRVKERTKIKERKKERERRKRAENGERKFPKRNRKETYSLLSVL